MEKYFKYILLLAVVFIMLCSTAQAVENYNADWEQGYLVYREASTFQLADVIAGHKVIKDFQSLASATGTTISAGNTSIVLAQDITLTADNSGSGVFTKNGLALTTGTAAKNTVQTAIFDNSFTGSKLAFIEARIVLNPTNTSAFVGFTDAYTYGLSKIPIGCRYSTVTANATDAVGFLFDCQDSAASGSRAVRYAYVKDGGTAVATATSELITAANEAHIYKVALDDTGKAFFYIDGVLVKETSAATVDYAQGYYPYIGAQSVSTGAKPITPTYLAAARKK